MTLTPADLHGRKQLLETFTDSSGQFCYRFTLPNAPRTKKNHGKVVQRGARKFHVPSDAFMEWQDGCVAHVMKNKALKLELAKPVRCTALFYRDRLTGDASGFYEGLGDVLQKTGVIVDDVLIDDWDGSRRLKDKDNPRTIVTLTVLNDD
jgi:Holliday junction resolvase RusA-like endonuclease